MSPGLRFKDWYRHLRVSQLPDGLQPDVAEAKLHEIYDRANLWMTRFIVAHFIAALLMMPVYETYSVSLITSFAALGLFLIPRFTVPYAFVTRVSAGISLQTFVALSIYQMGGLAEMHFFFFTAVTMMLIYMDGRAILPGVFLIIMQHILMAILEVQGVPDLAYWETTGDGRYFAMKLFFHFGIALLHVGLCFFWATSKRYHVLVETATQEEIKQSQLRLNDLLQRSEGQKEELQSQAKALIETQLKLEADIELRTQLERELATQFQALEQYKNLLEDQAEMLADTNSKLERIAQTDELTGLLNYRKFRDEFSRCLLEFHRTGRPFSLILADLDHFKSLNDQFGHQAGDETLRAAATLLKAHCGETALAFRYGGEEFAILLPNTSESEGLKFAKFLVEGFAASAWKHRLVTLSAGVATAGGDQTSDLLQQADQALYQAKAKGRNLALHIQDLPSAA